MRSIRRALMLTSIALSMNGGDIARTAQAGPIDGLTTCADVRGVLDAKNPDFEQARTIFEYINKTLVETDDLFVAQGRPSLLKHLAKGDHDNITLLVWIRCDIPNETLQITAINVYTEMRAAQGDFSE